MADYPYGSDRDLAREIDTFFKGWDQAETPTYVPLSEREMAFEPRPDTAQNRVEDFLYNLLSGTGMSPRGAMGATNAGMGAIDLAVGDLPYALADGRYGDAAGSLATDVAINALGLKALQAGGKIGRRALDKMGGASDGLFDIPQTPAGREYFVNNLRKAQASQGPIGKSVTVMDPDDYKGSTMLMSDDGLAGFAVSPDGELNSLVKHVDSPMRGFGTKAAERGTKEGGDWLNAFDTVLPGMYGKAGFSPVSRIGFSEEMARGDWGDEAAEAFMSANERFNGGRPDLVFMRQTGTPQRVNSGSGGLDYGSDYDGAHGAVMQSVAGNPQRSPEYKKLKDYIQSRLGR